MGAKELFEAAGLGTPFIYAGVTYSFFYWLDRNASAPATRAISAWLTSQSYRQIDVKSGILGAFDLIYSVPLLRWKAFFRSALLSSIVSVGYYSVHGELALLAQSYTQGYTAFASIVLSLLLASIILSDYCSLFIVRKCLIIFGDHPLSSLLIGICAGSMVVVVSFTSIIIIIALSAGIYGGFYSELTINLKYYYELLYYGPGFKLAVAFIPALFVHFWLLLFALGGLGVRVLYPIFRTVEFAQWFLRQGARHPLRAIGMVAAVLVFAGTIIWKALTVTT